jgi:gamma-polyglutamate synthase
MNILVEGSRGKSGTVETVVRVLEQMGESVVGKITGKDTMVFYEGKTIPVKRASSGFLLDQENRAILKQYAHCNYKVFENQALSCYTMRVIHNIVKPDVILIPNIRFEHQDRLGETIEDQAVSFAVNFKGVNTVITTEHKPIIISIFRKHCKKHNVNLIEVKKKEAIPSMQYLYLTEALIEWIYKKPIPNDIKRSVIRKVNRNLRLRSSQSIGIDYYNGAKVNDVESTQNVFEYLSTVEDKNYCFLCYFRKDRVERTEAFASFFAKYLDDSRITRFYVKGHLAGVPYHDKIVRVKEASEVYDYCRDNNLILFTAVNGVNDFMRGVEKDLAGAAK